MLWPDAAPSLPNDLAVDGDISEGSYLRLEKRLDLN